jgi:hypothetical protein
MLLDKVMVAYNFDMSPFIILHAIKSHIIYFTRYFLPYFLQKFTILVAHVWELKTFISNIYLYKRYSCPWNKNFNQLWTKINNMYSSMNDELTWLFFRAIGFMNMFPSTFPNKISQYHSTRSFKTIIVAK